MHQLERKGSFFLKNVRMLDPAQKVDRTGDILVLEGKVRDFGVVAEVPSSISVYEGGGALLVPGFIDVHAHFREPGFEYKETIESGSKAAVSGGFTSVCVMANTNPVNDHPGVTREMIRKAEDIGLCRIFPIGAVSIGLKGENLSEMVSLAEAGCIAFSDDGLPVRTAKLMRRALEYSIMTGLPIIDHCEDRDLSDGGVMNEGWVSTTLGLKGIPNASEDVVIARDIEVLRLTGGKLHIAHLSTEGGVRLVRQAKKDGLPVTAETCPHYFSLTDESVRHHHTNAKMNPPLRQEADRKAVIEGLADGTIDMIATDHAPHASHEKEREFDQAPFGIIGLETAFSLGYGLVESGELTLEKLILLMANHPAHHFRLPVGEVRIDGLADFTLLDLSKRQTVEKDFFRSKSRNSPFLGSVIGGEVKKTFMNGRLVFDRAKDKEVGR